MRKISLIRGLTAVMILSVVLTGFAGCGKKNNDKNSMVNAETTTAERESKKTDDRTTLAENKTEVEKSNTESATSGINEESQVEVVVAQGSDNNAAGEQYNNASGSSGGIGFIETNKKLLAQYGLIPRDSGKKFKTWGLPVGTYDDIGLVYFVYYDIY